MFDPRRNNIYSLTFSNLRILYSIEVDEKKEYPIYNVCVPRIVIQLEWSF